MLLVVVGGVTGCETKKLPASDSTPPTLTWHVENRTSNKKQEIKGVGHVYGKRGDEFRVNLVAQDPEGIKKITKVGGYEHTLAQCQHLARVPLSPPRRGGPAACGPGPRGRPAAPPGTRPAGSGG